MPKVRLLRVQLAKGFTLIEVLVTLVITAVALLGFVGLQNRAQLSELEASNRVHAILLVQHMAEQVKANPTLESVCRNVNSTTWTTKMLTNCPLLTTWKSLLEGDGETRDSQGTEIKVGGITNGKGCITYTASSAPNGLIKPAMYRVAVAWQGVNKSADGGDTNSCGYGDYGDDNGKHRLVSYDIYVGV